MGLVRRGEKAYLYTSERVGGRVVTTYFGSGELAELWAEGLADDRAEALERREEIRAEIRAARAEREATAKALDAAAGEALDLAALAMEAAGYHRHDRGAWRKRRRPVGDRALQASASGVPAVRTEAEDGLRADIARIAEGGPRAIREHFDHLEAHSPAGLMATLIEFHRGDPGREAEEALIRRFAGDDPMRREATRRRLSRFRDELAGPGPVTALEVILVDRATLLWLGACEADARSARSSVEAEGCHKYAARANRQFLQVLGLLDQVRRKAVPALAVQVNVHNEMPRALAGLAPADDRSPPPLPPPDREDRPR